MIFATVASGCINGSGGGQGLSISTPSVNPTEIEEGNTVNTDLTITNEGSLEGDVSVGNDGTDVLVNYCPDMFSIDEFDAASDRESEEQDSYKLGEGESLRLNWVLQQKEERPIPRNGFECDLSFEVPFDYSVTSFKQFQVKESREVEGNSELTTQISEGPMSVEFELIGSTADQSNTIIKGDNADLRIRISNPNREDSYQGLLDVRNLEITGSGDINISEDCGSVAQLETGEAKVYRCNLSYTDFETGTIRGAIEADADYTFVRNKGTRTVKVNRRGN